MNATKPALQSHLQTTMRLWPSGGTTTALSATTGSTTGGSGGAATWQLDSPAKRSPYGNTYNSQQRGAAVPKPYESVTDTTVNKSERLEFQAPQATDPKALLTKPLPSSADITASQLNMSVVRDGTVSQAYAGRWRSMYNAQYCRQPWHSCKA